MRWSIIDFNVLSEQLLPSILRKPKQLSIVKAFLNPLTSLHDTLLYKAQHDGRTIYLEKVLNEHFEIVDYDKNNHTATKKIYIEDVPQPAKLYIHQDDEADVVFIEDADSEDDLFLDTDDEGSLSYSFVIFIPDTVVFEEYQVRALVDEYRFIGHKYIIQTYTI